MESKDSVNGCYRCSDDVEFTLRNAKYIKPGCAKCTGGRILEKQTFGYVTTFCDCYKEYQFSKKLITRYKASNLPRSLFSLYKIHEFEDTDIPLNLLHRYITGKIPKPWLYISGTPGTGKTYAAMITAVLALGLGQSVYYANTSELLDAFRPHSGVDAQELMRKCTEVDFLILDDIGQEKVSEFVRERLYILLNKRYIGMKKTFITSNYSLDNISNRLEHPAIVSRIKHHAITLNGSKTDKRISLSPIK